MRLATRPLTINDFGIAREFYNQTFTSCLYLRPVYIERGKAFSMPDSVKDCYRILAHLIGPEMEPISVIDRAEEHRLVLAANYAAGHPPCRIARLHL